MFSNVSPETVLGLINAACGLDWTIQDMLRCGERGWNLKRAINNRLGLRHANDRLPKALLQPYSDDPESARGFAPDLQAMLESYYEVRGWDAASGFPTPQKLRELGLEFVLESLYPDMQKEGLK